MFLFGNGSRNIGATDMEICPKCGAGTEVVWDVNDGVWIVCKICDWRTKSVYSKGPQYHISI